MRRRRCFHGINAMILMLQMFDVTASKNTRYKRNELESTITVREVYPQKWEALETLHLFHF